jgi:hypothetical protein
MMGTNRRKEKSKLDRSAEHRLGVNRRFPANLAEALLGAPFSMKTVSTNTIPYRVLTVVLTKRTS